MLKQTLKILLHTGKDGKDGVNLRHWFVFYTLYMTSLAVLALIGLAYFESNGHTIAQHLWLLTLYVFYLSLCCTFFPAPTAWIVLLMASPIVNLNFVHTDNIYLSTLTTVVVVAALGALATAVANLNEYHVFTFLLRFRYVENLRRTRMYKSAARWFDISPFALITTVSFFPLPVDVVRWLAITRRYRRDRYFLAYFVGRFLRYFLLAGAAGCFGISWSGILIIQLCIIGFVLIRYLPGLKSYFMPTPDKNTELVGCDKKILSEGTVG